MSGLEYNLCYAVSNLQVFRRILHISKTESEPKRQKELSTPLPISYMMPDIDFLLRTMTMIVTATIWLVIRKLNTGIIEMEWNGNRMEIKLSLANNAVLQL